MKDLRILDLYQCETPHTLVHALHPSMSSSGVVVCPQLEELAIEHRRRFDMKDIVRTVAARASRGAKLKTVRIVSGRDELDVVDVLELGKHVWEVEHDPRVDVVDEHSDSSAEED